MLIDDCADGGGGAQIGMLIEDGDDAWLLRSSYSFVPFVVTHSMLDLVA